MTELTAIPCPSCGAPLAATGLCAYCNTQARGFWDDLDLGTPELASAVVAGLDYYLILDALPSYPPDQLADAYRRTRRLFPDELRRLAPQQARRVGLIEEAWRILGVAQRRAAYDRLRQRPPSSAEMRSLHCQQCGASLAPQSRFCPACGVARPAEVVAVAAQPSTVVPDYYDVLGVRPHFAVSESADRLASPWDLYGTPADVFGLSLPLVRVAPGDDEVHTAYLRRLQERMTLHDPAGEQDLEVAWRVLSDPQRRASYDELHGRIGTTKELGWVLQALNALDSEVRAEITGGAVAQADGAALVRQAQGYLRLNQPHLAVPALEQATELLPNSAEAHGAYVLALWQSANLTELTPFMLRRIERSASRVLELEPAAQARFEPYLLVARGLLRDSEGAAAAALECFTDAVRRYPTFVAAWRMRAALLLRQGQLDAVLACCQQALRLEPTNEAVLFLVIAACWRQGMRGRAREVAERIATQRGGTTADRVLAELGLR